MLKDQMRVSLRVSVYRGNLPLFPKTLFGLRSIDCEKCLILAMVIVGWAKYTRACEIRRSQSSRRVSSLEAIFAHVRVFRSLKEVPLIYCLLLYFYSFRVKLADYCALNGLSPSLAFGKHHLNLSLESSTTGVRPRGKEP